MTEKEDVEQFLKDFFQYWPTACYVVDREVNENALFELDLTPKIRQEAILSLTYQDCDKGPKPDRDESGDVWEFGKMVEGTEIYIKLKLFTTNKGISSAKCISFHKAEWPFRYPFK